ncbi:MAG: hypothetical protein HQL22_05280 [Candidatus Omnitrophica bacterium]|nr:hypothetical protein [Candidatus Omnitrophota bacterium]
MNEKWRKFLAFEWLMFLIVGFFWAAAMAIPLLFTRSFEDKGLFWQNFVVMFGLYLVYLAGRLLFLLFRSLRWAYLVSNVFFTSETQKRFADEWTLFVLLFIFWSLVIVYPLWFLNFFARKEWPIALLIMAAPYTGFIFARWAFVSARWAVRSSTEQ